MADFSPTDEGQEEFLNACTVHVHLDGPLLVTGDLRISVPGGDKPVAATRVFLCRCGASKNKPFCDGAHKEIGFEDHSESIDIANAVDDGSRLKPAAVTATLFENGPLRLDGVVRIKCGESDGQTHTFSRPTLCRCGASKNKPFCDGMHNRSGFTAGGS
jgi:CDGSH-type Zn-finger protein